MPVDLGGVLLPAGTVVLSELGGGDPADLINLFDGAPWSNRN